MLKSSAQSVLKHDSSLISTRWIASACGKSCSASTPGAPSCRVRQVPTVVDDRLHHHREEDGVAAIIERNAQVGPPEPQRQDGLDTGGKRHAEVRQ